MPNYTSPSSAKTDQIETIIDEPNCDRRLDAFLAELYPIYSRTQISKAIKMGFAVLDGKTAKPSSLLKTGQRLIFKPLPLINTDLLPDNDLKLDIIYQDNDILVINKPAGLKVHPGAGLPGPTLAGALLAFDPNLAPVGLPGRPGLVHRLDRDTSGVLVTARNQATYAFLNQAFADRNIDKRYLAFVRGQLPDNGKIDSPIGRHPTQRHKMRVGSLEDRASCTLFRVIRRFPLTGISLVAITLLTGRTHQARVHLASIGAPVLADPVYGRKLVSLFKQFPSLVPLLKRQFLHARRLTIPHPSGGRLAFRAPWPQDFRELLEELIRLEKNIE